jgi:hypothetical protein
MMETHYSPTDSTELASTYGVTPTSLAELVCGSIASNRHGLPRKGNSAAL